MSIRFKLYLYIGYSYSHTGFKSAINVSLQIHFVTIDCSLLFISLLYNPTIVSCWMRGIWILISFTVVTRDWPILAASNPCICQANPCHDIIPLWIGQSHKQPLLYNSKIFMLELKDLKVIDYIMTLIRETPVKLWILVPASLNCVKSYIFAIFASLKYNTNGFFA